MTRINIINPEELNNKMLVAEAHEITRVFGLARKAQFDIVKGKRMVPQEYTLGTGHVIFFYPRLKFIADRYESLVLEMQRRGYKPNPISREELLAGINPKLYNDYQPTAEAIAVNRQRIQERLSAKVNTSAKKAIDTTSIANYNDSNDLIDRVAEENFQEYLSYRAV